MSRIGYIRVSTEHQETARQLSEQVQTVDHVRLSGRPHHLREDFGQLYGEWKSKSITGRDFMRRMGLSANTFYRRIREYEAEHGIAEPTSA